MILRALGSEGRIKMKYSLGETIKKLRIDRGLSQDELADILNDRFGSTINKGMISKWENDLGEPRLETVRILALFFKVKLDDLFGISHDDGDEWTDEELETIKKFKEFIRSQRNKG